MEGKALKINECSVLLLRGVTRYAFHVHTDSKGHQERPRGAGGGKHIRNHLPKRLLVSEKGRPVSPLD